MMEENGLPKGWVETELRNVVSSANTGLDAIKRAPIVVEETGIKCFRIQDASQKKGFARWGNTKVDEKNYDRFKLIQGDILVARTGNTIGVNYLVKKNMNSVFNNGLIRLRVNNKIDYTFLYKIIESRLFDKYIQSIAYGTSTQPNMQINALLGFKIYLPPIPEQKAIASILTSFDDKIELLQAQNETLETIAQTIFKEWFGKYKVGDELPDGWRVGKLGDVVNLFDSQRIPLSKSQREERKGSYRYYGATNIMDYIDDYIFDGIYLLFAEDGSVIDENGNPVLQYVWGKFWVNNHAHIIQGTNGLSTELLYVFCKNMRVESIINGAVQLKINQRNLLGFDIVIPKKEFLLKLDNLIQPLFEKVRKNNQQIQTLQATRDTLLPKLMSGQLRVAEFQEQLSEVM